MKISYKLFLLILFSIKPQLALDNFEATFINVGQGNCTLVKCPKGPPLLYDAGSFEPAPIKADIAGRVIERLDPLISEWQLYKRNHSNLQPLQDMNVVISHAHEDHYNLITRIINGVRSIYPAVKINFLFGGDSNEYGELLPYLEDLIYTSHSQAMFTSSGLPFTSYPNNIFYFDCGDVSPYLLSANTQYTDPNQKSIALQLKYKNRAITLTGDAGRDIENLILQLEFDFNTSVFVAGHHGSKTSTSKEFVMRTQPEICIISAKTCRRYYHPQLQPIANMAGAAKVLNIAIPLSFCHNHNPYNVITNIAILSTQNLGDIHIKLNNVLEYSYVNIHALDNYVPHTRPGKKFMDFSLHEQGFKADEFTTLTQNFDQTIQFIFLLKYDPSPNPEAISFSRFKEMSGITHETYDDFLASINLSLRT